MVAEVSDSQACTGLLARICFTGVGSLRPTKTKKNHSARPGTITSSPGSFSTHLCDPQQLLKPLADSFWIFPETCVSAFAASMCMKITFADVSRIGIFTYFSCHGAFAKTILHEIFHGSFATILLTFAVACCTPTT